MSTSDVGTSGNHLEVVTLYYFCTDVAFLTVINVPFQMYSINVVDSSRGRPRKKNKKKTFKHYLFQLFLNVSRIWMALECGYEICFKPKIVVLLNKDVYPYRLLIFLELHHCSDVY